MTAGTSPEHDARGARWTRPLALLLFVVVAGIAFGSSLAFPLTDADDLILLSWVSTHATPFAAFVGDWGLGNSRYRPLHTLSLWVSYRGFGVNAVMHQLVNLSLHLLCVWLLYEIVRSVQRDRWLAWLFAAMALVSTNTSSAATWISDRPTMFVAAAVLMWLRRAGWSPNAGPAVTRRPVAWLIGLSVLALMSKESAIMLPGLAAIWALAGFAPAGSRRRVVLTAALLVCGYGALRWWMFGAGATSDFEGGYRFGVYPFSAFSDLAGPDKVIVAADTIVKNLVAPWLPVFTFDGAWSTIAAVARGSVVWLPTLVLLAAAARRPLSPTQWAGLALVGLDAVVHFALFRYRMFYLSQVGLCLFLAGASWSRFGAARRPLVVAVATLAVLVNMAMAVRGSRANLRDRQALLSPAVFDQMVIDWDGRIDKALADRVLREAGFPR